MKKVALPILAGLSLALGAGTAQANLLTHPPHLRVCYSTYSPCAIPDSQLAPVHSCPQFTDTLNQSPVGNEGYYQGFTAIRTSIPCGKAERQLVQDIALDDTYDSYMPFQRHDWWVDVAPNRPHTVWQKVIARGGYRGGPPIFSTLLELQRGWGAIETNWYQALSNQPTMPFTMMSGTVLFDEAQLRVCRGVALGHQIACRTVTWANYNGIRR